jgi:hypothetical protein
MIVEPCSVHIERCCQSWFDDDRYG